MSEQSAVDIMHLLKWGFREVVWPPDVGRGPSYISMAWHLIYLDGLLEVQTYVSLSFPFGIKMIKYIKVTCRVVQKDAISIKFA